MVSLRVMNRTVHSHHLAALGSNGGNTAALQAASSVLGMIPVREKDKKISTGQKATSHHVGGQKMDSQKGYNAPEDLVKYLPQGLRASAPALLFRFPILSVCLVSL